RSRCGGAGNRTNLSKPLTSRSVGGVDIASGVHRPGERYKPKLCSGATRRALALSATRSVVAGHAGGRVEGWLRPMKQLRSLDAQFLALENARQTGHVAGLAVHDPSTAPDGRLTAASMMELLRERMHLLPPLRWRLI